MKKALLLVALLLLSASCAGSMKDIRIGHSFAILIPDEIPVYTEPHPDAKLFYLEEAEEFEVVDAVCTDGVSLIMCGWEMAAAMDNPDFFKVRWMKVRFESGKQGYINGLYFFPELSYHMTSEKRTKVINGTTPKEYAALIRKNDRKLEAEIARLAEERLENISASSWPEHEKQMVRDFKVWVGMTGDQLVSSQAPLRRRRVPILPVVYSRVGYMKTRSSS